MSYLDPAFERAWVYHDADRERVIVARGYFSEEFREHLHEYLEFVPGTGAFERTPGLYGIMGAADQTDLDALPLADLDEFCRGLAAPGPRL